MNSQAYSRTVTVQVVSLRYEGLSSIICPACRADLDLAQPDPYAADRLLGTCGECSGWFLVDLAPNAGTVRVVSLASITEMASGARLRPRQAEG